MATEREQKLVDIMFQVAQLSAKHFHSEKTTQEEHMSWVAKQLKDNGFETTPCGASWGVLVK